MIWVLRSLAAMFIALRRWVGEKLGQGLPGAIIVFTFYTAIFALCVRLSTTITTVPSDNASRNNSA